MSVAAVTPIDSVRGRKPRKAAKDDSAKDRLTEAVGKATTPGQIVAAALDYLRVQLAQAAKADPNAAMTKAWEVHQDLLTHANQIAPRR